MQTRVLVTGASGQLGSEVVSHLGERPLVEVVAADRSRLDVTSRDQVLMTLEELAPDVVVHAAAWTAVDACESDPDRAWQVNAMGTRHVAEGARRVGAHVVYISTDYVFDGTAGPYVEWDEPRPLSVYGRSKLGGERELGPDSTVVRTSWVCGARGGNFVRTMLRLAGGEGTVDVVDDQLGCPTFAADLARAVTGLARDRRPGVYHVTNGGETSWFRFAQAVFEEAGADAGRVRAISTAAMDPPRPAPRPARATLDNAGLRLAGLPLLPPWQDSLRELVAELSG
ncbi:MAG: dTDP-4-dehydrorhamnose reductase [Acidimicrobiales bacterium]